MATLGTIPLDDQPTATGESHDYRGVDVTLIDEMLRLSPLERLRLNDRAATAARKLRNAFGVGESH